MPTQLSDIISLVRMRSNMENNFNVSDVELTIYINNSLAELDDVLVSRYEDYKVETFQAVLPADASSNVIPIPSDFYKLRGVDVQCGQTGQQPSNWITLRSFQLPERNRNNNRIAALSNLSLNASLTYRLSADGIIIMPQAIAAGNYQIWYTPKYQPLKDLFDVLSIQMDTQAWLEYAIVDCCIKIYNKQNLDPSAFMQEKAALLNRINAVAKNRDAAGPKHVANTRFCNADNFPLWNRY